MRKEYEASGKTVDEAIDAACILANTTIDMVEVEVLEFGSKGLFGLGAKNARVRVVVNEPDPVEAPPKVASAASTFGTKKSKKERLEQKEKKKEELEIKPVVVVDPATVTPEQAAQVQEQTKAQQSRQARRRGNRSQREDQHESAEPREQKKAQAAAERPRRESRASAVTEGEVADTMTTEAMTFLLPIFDKLQIEPQVSTSVQDGILWLNFSGQNMGLLIGRRGETLDALQYLTNLVVNKKHKEHVRLILNVEGYRESREETLITLAHKMADKAVKSGRRVELKPMNPHERRVIHIALQDDKRVETSSHGEEPYRCVVISCKRARRDRRSRRSSNRQPAATAVAAENSENPENAE